LYLIARHNQELLDLLLLLIEAYLHFPKTIQNIEEEKRIINIFLLDNYAFERTYDQE
jgi:hypothetical protein